MFRCFILFFSSFVFSQNLVRNPSFEELKRCSEKLGLFEVNVANWSAPTYGSSDIFNSCSNHKDTGIPNNYKGMQNAYHGDNYAGIFVLGYPRNGSYREYLQGEFIEPLKKGYHYQLSFYVSPAEDSDFFIKDLGMSFSLNKFRIYNSKEIKNPTISHKTYITGFADLTNYNYFSNTKIWTKVSSIYVAKGGERFFQIGNFKNNRETTKISKGRKTRKKISYLYIDMVTVEENTNLKSDLKNNKVDNLKPSSKPPINFDFGVNYEIKGLKFYFDSDVIVPGSDIELKKLLKILLENKEILVTIHGHTDSQGSEDYNLKLSIRRADAIKSYFIENDIAPNRIKSVGHGESMLMNKNQDEIANEQNRRVEFTLYHP